MNKLKTIRTSQGITQADLASKSRVHKPIISMLERGAPAFMESNLHIVDALAEALGVTRDELLELSKEAHSLDDSRE